MMRSLAMGLFVTMLILLLSSCGKANRPASNQPPREFEGRKLVLFVGSASQPPTELAAQRFEEKTGAKLEVHFGGSGTMLAQMRLAEQGDIYFPGSSDYMELAKREGDVNPDSEVIVSYLIPAINVPKGNPNNVRSIEDLAKPGIRVAIARPDTVCVGLYAVELLETSGLASQVRPNIVTHTESCAKTAQIVALAQVDAVLGWRVFEYWEPDKIQTVLLPKDRVTRVGYIPAAIGANSREPQLARAFLEFLTSEQGQVIYRQWHYLTSVEETRQFTRDDAPVGGTWPLPEGW